jgi:hypothetical protein
MATGSGGGAATASQRLAIQRKRHIFILSLREQKCPGLTSEFDKGGEEVPGPLASQKEFSGKFVLRVDPALHRRLAAKAIGAGESLNSYCVKALAKA